MKFAWHIHHDLLVEPLTEPLENRIAYIKKHKPEEECELRLRLLQVVRGCLPDSLIEAGRVYDEAWKAYDKVWKTYGETWKNYEEVGKIYGEARRIYKTTLVYHKEILALHAAECPDCPWDGETIFPNR